MPNNADDVMVLPKTTTYFICQESIKMKPFWFFTQMLSKKKTERFCFVKEVNEQSNMGW
jgi:hypothetical protein